jgi:protein-L-isoaspartate O-methyltransferase
MSNTNTTTGYKYTGEINAILVTAGLKKIPAQMVYQYLAKGYIPFVDVDGQRLVDLARADEWLERYLNRRVEKATK